MRAAIFTFLSLFLNLSILLNLDIAGGQDSTVTLIHTNNLQGEVAPCPT